MDLIFDLSEIKKACENIEHKAKVQQRIYANIISRKYFNLKPVTERRYSREGKLGVQAFQIRKSSNSPWFIKVADLERVFGKI